MLYSNSHFAWNRHSDIFHSDCLRQISTQIEAYRRLSVVCGGSSMRAHVYRYFTANSTIHGMSNVRVDSFLWWLDFYVFHRLVIDDLQRGIWKQESKLNDICGTKPLVLFLFLWFRYEIYPCYVRWPYYLENVQISIAFFLKFFR